MDTEHTKPNAPGGIPGRHKKGYEMDKQEFTLTSAKGNVRIRATLDEAIRRAEERNRKLLPAWGVQVEDENGEVLHNTEDSGVSAYHVRRLRDHARWVLTRRAGDGRVLAYPEALLGPEEVVATSRNLRDWAGDEEPDDDACAAFAAYLNDGGE